MSRIFLSFICLFASWTINAQYTDIINSNTPGSTDTPYAVGTDVLQFENIIGLQNFDNQQSNTENKLLFNDLNVRYGFWKEKLEANFNYNFTTQNNTTGSFKSNITGTKKFSLGLKYLVYDHEVKESLKAKKSWKSRYGIKAFSLPPSVALAFNVNAPLVNSRFGYDTTTFRLAIITQNHFWKWFRINNNFEMDYLGSDNPEFIHSISAAYSYHDNYNFFAEHSFHSQTLFNYGELSVGGSYLINNDFIAHLGLGFNYGKNISGSLINLGVSYRIDQHKDKWVTLKPKTVDKKIKKVRKKKEIKKKSQKDEYLDSLFEAPKKREKLKSKDDLLEEYFEEYDKEEAKKEKKNKKKKNKAESIILGY
ncbi:hypothetical protein N9901_00325 [Flavobacteriaceae bacterium]|nr:hypothetical protein [Flavobacteriaceae bacterium]